MTSKVSLFSHSARRWWSIFRFSQASGFQLSSDHAIFPRPERIPFIATERTKQLHRRHLKKNKDAHSTINESDLDVSNERYGGDRLPSAWSLYDGWEEPENRVGPPRRTRIFWIDRLFWRFRDQRVSHLCPTSPLPYLCYRGQHQICIRFSAAKNNTDRLSVVVMSTDRSDQWKPLQFVQC